MATTSKGGWHVGSMSCAHNPYDGHTLRAAIEPGIGHQKAEQRLEGNQLWGERGDMVNAILSAAGMNFAKLRRRAAALSHAWLAALRRLVSLMGYPRAPRALQIKDPFA